MAIVTNNVEVIGRLNRVDARFGNSKDGRPFVSMTFTLEVEDNLIKIESFSMQYKKNSEEELGSYKGLMTILNESFALHKTIKKVGEDQATTVEDETIVENIDECDAIRFSNYGNFKYCRLVENVYAKEGELVKSIRVEGAYPNRLDESKKEYVPTADFEIAGVVTKAPVSMEVDEEECMQMTVVVPVYQDAWGDREASVTLHEVQVRTYDSEVFGYLEDNFEKDRIVYLNGRIVREVKRVEMETMMDDAGRGFGRTMKREPSYRTEVNEYYEILGGYPLDEDEIEETKALDMELWEKALQVKKEKEQEMLEGGEKPKANVGFGRSESKPKTKNSRLPF